MLNKNGLVNTLGAVANSSNFFKGGGGVCASSPGKDRPKKGLPLTRKFQVKFIPRKYFFAFAFILILIGTDDLSHSCPHRYFTPNFTFAFAFAFVILKVITVAVEIKSILIPKKLIVEFEMTFFGK